MHIWLKTVKIKQTAFYLWFFMILEFNHYMSLTFAFKNTDLNTVRIGHIEFLSFFIKIWNVLSWAWFLQKWPHNLTFYNNILIYDFRNFILNHFTTFLFSCFTTKIWLDRYNLTIFTVDFIVFWSNFETLHFKVNCANFSHLYISFPTFFKRHFKTVLGISLYFSTLKKKNFTWSVF